ncbi:MAG: hypothetical protein AAFY88_13300 [Acidobacteriota bacterium]
MPVNLENRRKKTVPAVTNLGRLIARLALDDALHAQFLAKPKSVIAKAGLSKAEKKALKNEDWPAILQLLGPDDRGGPNPGAQRDSNDEGGG